MKKATCKDKRKTLEMSQQSLEQAIQERDAFLDKLRELKKNGHTFRTSYAQSMLEDLLIEYEPIDFVKNMDIFKQQDEDDDVVTSSS